MAECARSFTPETDMPHMSKSEQRTPKGTRIPVPKRGDFFDNLKKAATPEKSGKSGPKQK
jgi:hypothetical protein